MIDERFIILGTILSFIGGASYLIDTIRGRVKPNRVTWLLWALAPLIAFAAELGEGVGIQSLLTFIVGFNPLCIFIASFINKKSVWKITRLDILCGSISILGIFLWYATKVGNIAIVFSILADAAAGIPTVIKSFNNPETESSTIYFLTSINAVITLLTIKEWNFARWGFPFYILCLCVSVFTIIRFRLGKRIRGN
jgi:hypothetical protein